MRYDFSMNILQMWGSLNSSPPGLAILVVWADPEVAARMTKMWQLIADKCPLTYYNLSLHNPFLQN